MLRVKKDVKPVLIQVGVVIALSFAAFFFSRRRTRKTKPSLPPTSPCHSDHSNGTNSGGHRSSFKEELHGTTTPHCSRVITSIVAGKHDGIYLQKVHSPSSGHSGEKEGLLLPEFDDLVKEFDNIAGISPNKDVDTLRSDVETPKSFITAERDVYEQEIKQLKNMVRMLRERERNLEIQLLEYYGLKEQEAAVTELQNRLKINNMEAKLFNLKIESLQAENRRLESQAVDHTKVVAELEASKSKIKMLKKKLKFEAEQNREQILLLQKKVAKLLEEECRAGSLGAEAELKLGKLKQLEHEVEDLRKSNMRLQLENSDLARRLESTQLIANCVLEDPEAEALKKDGELLRQENENLAKEMEQLKADRCSDVEELVYLRWINACLRYELRNYHPPAGKTIARDLSKTLSPKSEEKAKQLILEYASTEGAIDKGMAPDFDSDQWSSSQNSSQHSYYTDSGEGDETYADVHPSSKTTNPRKAKLFGKLRKLVLGKDGRHDRLRPSTEKMENPEVGMLDSYSSDSPRGSSSMTPGTDVGSNWPGTSMTTPCRNSCRSSLDIHRLRSLKMDDLKDAERFRRRSDSGSSFHFRKSITGREDPTQENFHEADSLRKYELSKFAQVLKGSRNESEGTIRRKSASFSSF